MIRLVLVLQLQYGFAGQPDRQGVILNAAFSFQLQAARFRIGLSLRRIDVEIKNRGVEIVQYTDPAIADNQSMDNGEFLAFLRQGIRPFQGSIGSSEFPVRAAVSETVQVQIRFEDLYRTKSNAQLQKFRPVQPHLQGAQVQEVLSIIPFSTGDGYLAQGQGRIPAEGPVERADRYCPAQAVRCRIGQELTGDIRLPDQPPGDNQRTDRAENGGGKDR